MSNKMKNDGGWILPIIIAAVIIFALHSTVMPF